jgi:hypothetical protein
VKLNASWLIIVLQQFNVGGEDKSFHSLDFILNHQIYFVLCYEINRGVKSHLTIIVVNVHQINTGATIRLC